MRAIKRQIRRLGSHIVSRGSSPAPAEASDVPTTQPCVTSNGLNAQLAQEIRPLGSRIAGRDSSPVLVGASDVPTTQPAVIANDANTLVTEAQDTNTLATQHRDSDAPGKQVSSLEPHSDKASVSKMQTKASDIAHFMQNVDQDFMEKFGRFRIIIIGRANAGKTTVLQRICNWTEDPEIYNDRGVKVPFTKLELLDTDIVDVRLG